MGLGCTILIITSDIVDGDKLLKIVEKSLKIKKYLLVQSGYSHSIKNVIVSFILIGLGFIKEISNKKTLFEKSLFVSKSSRNHSWGREIILLGSSLTAE
jgi:hypothetical protein